MKIILQESYMNLGEAGELVDVKPGYARNFLIPQKIAVSATAGNVRRFQDKAKEMEQRREKERDNARKVMSSLQSLKVVLKKKVSEDGRLFGSVTTKDIEENLVAQGANVDRRQIVLGRQIKMIGEYQILIKLVGGIKTNLPLIVESESGKVPGNMLAATTEAVAEEVAAAEEIVEKPAKAEKKAKGKKKAEATEDSDA